MDTVSIVLNGGFLVEFLLNGADLDFTPLTIHNVINIHTYFALHKT